MEISLVGLGYSADDYFDRDVKYDNKRKSTDNKKPLKKPGKQRNSDDSDIFVIQNTEVTLKSQDFILVAFVRPEWVV